MSNTNFQNVCANPSFIASSFTFSFQVMVFFQPSTQAFSSRSHDLARNFVTSRHFSPSRVEFAGRERLDTRLVFFLFKFSPRRTAVTTLKMFIYVFFLFQIIATVLFVSDLSQSAETQKHCHHSEKHPKHQNYHRNQKNLDHQHHPPYYHVP